MKESGKERLKYVVYESTLSTADASIFIKSDARSRIILAPSSGRGRGAKRGGVGIPASENSASRANLRPFGAPPSKGRREKSGVR